MALAEAVRFRSLSDQLSKAEKCEMITKLINEDIDMIFNALSSHFINPTNNTQHIAENMSERISNIIRNRKKKPKLVIKKQLDYLSKPLIGHIASYLDQYSYARWSECNRSIYLGCNAPNKLQEIR